MIHPLAQVLTNNIGENTNIWQFSIVLDGAVIGSNCNINCHTFIENQVTIGDNVTLKSGVQVWNGVNLEDNVFIGPNVTFTNDLMPRSKVYREVYLKTKVDIGASIGANATIIAGNKIGKYSLIGAGSVVTKDIPPFTVWYGNPAKHMGYVTKDGQKVGLNLKDKEGNDYTYLNEELNKKIK